MLHVGYAQNNVEKKNIEIQINQAGKYFNEGKYVTALQFSKEALVRSFKIEDDYLIAHSYNSIGVIYDEFSESKRAIEFYNKALLYASNIENDSLKDWIYSNLGSTYYFNKIDVNKGINYYKKSLKYSEKIKDSVQITYGKLNIASAYFSINDFKSGIAYINQSESYIKRKGQPEMHFTLASLLGIYHSGKNQIPEAEKYYFEAVAIAQKNKMDSYLINIYENLADHYKKFDKTALAQEYTNKVKTLSAVTYSEKNRQALEKSAIQIELDEYKIQLEKIESQYKIQHQKLKESNLVVLLFVVVCFVLSLLIYTLYKTNNFRKKLNDEMLQTNLDLQIAKEKAEEASHMKSQFVSTITHELRTPLYGVVGITNMISDEHKELADSPHLISLKFSARYLLSLVNDILQINKMEDKRIVLEKLDFNLKEEVDIILKSVHYIAHKNGNEIVINIDDAIPNLLIGDKLRLSQIIMNLTSNALKFTKNGTVTIDAKQIKIEGKQHFIKFKIIDNGVGIALNDQNKIFDKFVQVGRKVDDYQGTGLGLTIVKKLIELFGSEIYLESKPDEGTTFSFSIGFETDLERSKKAIEEAVEISFISNEILNVLIVEDNKINQIVTQKIMNKNNCRCDIANDGYEALHLLEKKSYDIILMDINMPIIDGFETTKRIRNLGIKTPVIALTAFDKDEITEAAKASGMNEIIIKPFEPAKLFQIINSQLHKTKKAV